MPRKKQKIDKPVKPVFHIYCEGEKTEPSYIRGFIKFFYPKHRQILVVEDTKKNTPVQLVDVANNQLREHKHDIYWVVFDRESVAKYSDALHNKARQKANGAGINIAISNVCFEQWLLAHFTSSTTSYSNYSDLLMKSPLNKSLEKIGVAHYEKAIDVFFRIRTEIPTAIKNAIEINKIAQKSAALGNTQPHHLNPYTDVYELLIDIHNFVSGKTSIRDKNKSNTDQQNDIEDAVDYFDQTLKTYI